MYYEGIDYHIRKLPFPNLASESLLLSNGDGSYVILLNSRFPEEVLRARLVHELEHLRQDHLHQPERPVTEKEAEAEGRPAPRTAQPPQPGPQPTAMPAFVPVPEPDYFRSWGRAMRWVRELLEQEGPGEGAARSPDTY